mmetsp:Transcript_845/g.1317  ORF Transcript_845/g.1317 Transcript_845/m.1317 type:complete len:210 (-) Transcript_845:391-1020(-)
MTKRMSEITTMSTIIILNIFPSKVGSICSNKLNINFSARLATYIFFFFFCTCSSSSSSIMTDPFSLPIWSSSVLLSSESVPDVMTEFKSDRDDDELVLIKTGSFFGMIVLYTIFSCSLLLLIFGSSFFVSSVFFLDVFSISFSILFVRSNEKDVFFVNFGGLGKTLSVSSASMVFDRFSFCPFGSDTIIRVGITFSDRFVFNIGFNFLF